MATVLDIGKVFGDWVWPLLEFFIGVGLVIFVHELGHFLACKMVGIRVDKFAMGIGPKLLGFKRGETEYCLNLLVPLGGYVKMLGQDDVAPPPEQGNPAKEGEAAAQAPPPAAAAKGLSAGTKALATAVSIAGAPPAILDEDPVHSPRAFQNKSVGARMLVISGGVVMNVVFGAILFVIVALVGKPFMAPVVGGVVAGSPASRAAITWQTPPTTMPATAPAYPDANLGLRPGDRIVRIDGDSFLLKLIRKNVEYFEKVVMIAMLANDDDRYTMTIHRQEGNTVLVGEVHMGVKARPSELGTSRRGFGIAAPEDTVVAKPLGRVMGPLKPGDRVVSIGGRKIEQYWDIDAAQDHLDGNVVDVAVLRDGNLVHFAVLPSLDFSQEKEIYFSPKDGSRLEGLPEGQADASFLWKTPEGALVSPKDSNFALVSTPDGNREAYPKDKLAGGNTKERLDILGLIPRILVEGVTAGSPADRGGMEPGDIIYEYGDVRTPTKEQLQEISKRSEGSGTSIVLLRGEKLLEPNHVTPKNQQDRALLGFVSGADIVHPVVAGVREGSPAARAMVRPGDVIEAVNGRPVHSWIDIFRQVQAAEGQAAKLTIRRGDATVEADLGEVTPRLFDPSDYHFQAIGDTAAFEPLLVMVRKTNPLAGVSWGLNQTWEFVLNSYATLKQLITGRVSGKEAAGPVGVGQMAVLAARKDVIHLVYLMAVISASVAVVNFLPFPVLDGGHAAMLILEKIRGRPLPVRVMWAMQVFGLVCIGVLFLLLTWNDIVRIFRGL